jgi:hypothetical protein
MSPGPPIGEEVDRDGSPGTFLLFLSTPSLMVGPGVRELTVNY